MSDFILKLYDLASDFITLLFSWLPDDPGLFDSIDLSAFSSIASWLNYFIPLQWTVNAFLIFGSVMITTEIIYLSYKLVIFIAGWLKDFLS